MYYFNVFFQRFIPNFIPLKPFFKNNFSDGKWAVFVILPTANLTFFELWAPFSVIYGTDSGLKKYLNWIFVVVLSTKNFEKKRVLNR